MSNPRHRSLLWTWSFRYFVTLGACAVIIVAIGLYAMYLGSVSKQRTGMERIAQEIADAIANNADRIPQDTDFAWWLFEQSQHHGLHGAPIVFLANREGQVIEGRTFGGEAVAIDWSAVLPPLASIDQARIVEIALPDHETSYLVAVQPLESSAVAQPPAQTALLVMQRDHFLEFVISADGRFWRHGLLITVIISGWFVFYLLTRRLTRPILQAASTAKQIVRGEYDVRLNTNLRERELHELMVSFQEMADRLKHLESLRTQLVAGVTHELKTPIAGINGLIQAVKDGVVRGPDVDEYLDLSLQESGRLRQLVEDLLEYSRFAGNVIKVNRTRVSPGTLIAEILERWQRGGALPPSLRVSVCSDDESRDVSIWTDPHRVEQILINLLNNARDALSKGGKITVKSKYAGDRWEIQVADSGSGIAPDERKEIFEPFYRGRGKRTKVRGLGLGLPFSRMAARSLGGELTLNESGPQGTTFTLSLPLAGGELAVERPAAG